MKVLAATDGSPSSLRALRYIVDHTALFGAEPEIVLVNVHREIPIGRAVEAAGEEAVAAYYRDACEDALRPARAILRDSRCRVTERPIIGEPAPKLVEAALQHGCELIVMGTHGHSAVGQLFMGSVAMKVIAASPVPVLMVK